MRSHQLTATQALESIQQRNLSAFELLQSCLDRIAERQADVEAWEYLNLNDVFQTAKRLDVAQTRGNRLKPLHGIPVGIKDTFATVDMPTRWGTPIHVNQQFDYDAAVVERLRAAGAIILGKTVTTEYAIARPGKTRNPHQLSHTPGASSSGSAAAVADRMVPVAIGTQMVGSILRPAAYCGIIGFKPSFGLVSRYGVMPSSRELDHVGIFARSIADIARVFKALAGVDHRDPDCRAVLVPAAWEEQRPPKLALVLTPHWSHIEAEAEAALFNSISVFTKAGVTITEINLPPEFDAYFEHISVLSAVGMANHHRAEYDRHGDQMSEPLRHIIQKGRTISAIAHAEACQAATHYNAVLAKLWSDFDAILTPVTTGTAPLGLDNTGSPIFCALWTLCGLPAISIPAGTAKNSLPLGIQLVGRQLGDWNLLAIAQWAMDCLSQQQVLTLLS
jgi:Asp-tRNA(Asn)/Glu-tRNA(Gln) amidotransferase A subunit family amidase